MPEERISFLHKYQRKLSGKGQSPTPCARRSSSSSSSRGSFCLAQAEGHPLVQQEEVGDLLPAPEESGLLAQGEGLLLGQIPPHRGDSDWVSRICGSRGLRIAMRPDLRIAGIEDRNSGRNFDPQFLRSSIPAPWQSTILPVLIRVRPNRYPRGAGGYIYIYIYMF